MFDPLRAGDLTLSNRIVMAALTRARAGRTHIPNALMANYYSQRASAGLIITEATMVADDGCAFTGEGGLFDEACVTGWRAVTGGRQDFDRDVDQLWIVRLSPGVRLRVTRFRSGHQTPRERDAFVRANAFVVVADR